MLCKALLWENEYGIKSESNQQEAQQWERKLELMAPGSLKAFQVSKPFPLESSLF